MFARSGPAVNLRSFVASAMSGIRQRDYLDVHASRSGAELQTSLLNFADRIGFERLTAVLVLDRPGENKQTHLVSNMPAELAKKSASLDAGLRDPVLDLLKLDGKPFVYDQSTYVGAGSADLWEEQAAFGYKTGISVALHTGSGLHFYLGMGRVRRLPQGEIGCTRLLADIHLLATYAQEAACKVFEPAADANQPIPRLSTREREVLGWVRDGKSAWAIGAILGISEHTVEFHCVNARRKMDTSTTHAAVLRAMSKGLL